jgi:hypothetical protein
MSLHVTLSATGVARYYFNLARDGERITDDEGVELQPNDLQHDVMLRVVQSLRSSEGSDLVEGWRGWSLEVTGGSGDIVQIIPL